MGDHSILSLVQGTGGSQMGPNPENRTGDRDVESPGRTDSSGLQVPGEPGHFRERLAREFDR